MEKRMVRCGNSKCRIVLEEDPPNAERRPCPNCGGMTRVLEVEFIATVTMTGTIPAPQSTTKPLLPVTALFAYEDGTVMIEGLTRFDGAKIHVDEKGRIVVDVVSQEPE